MFDHLMFKTLYMYCECEGQSKDMGAMCQSTLYNQQSTSIM